MEEKFSEQSIEVINFLIDNFFYFRCIGSNFRSEAKAICSC